MNESINLKERKKARALALQALYQWGMSGTDLHTIEKEFAAHYDVSKVDMDYFRVLLYQIPKQIRQTDEVFSQYLDREIGELNPVELAILRIGSYELMARPEIPYRVVIKEAVGLAKNYGASEGHKYVNGVLDKAARHYRKTEYNLSSDG